MFTSMVLLYLDPYPYPRRRRIRRRAGQSGISLIELVMFMVIVSVGVVGILSVMNVTTQHSADPMVRKQAMAIAESLMEEIQLQPFTYCSADDAQAATATGSFTGPTGCAGAAEGLGPEAGETRYASSTPFNHVNDYSGFAMTGITGLDGAAIAGLGNYNASVTITEQAVGGVPAADSLQIEVRVTSGSAVDVTLTGYRMRYAPNAAP